jgi:peptidoglycan hydrolase-like protein with peptidoglycan-binding domain
MRRKRLMRSQLEAGPFNFSGNSEAEAMELVTELFEIQTQEELDQFLGKLISKVGQAASGAVRAVQKAVRSLPLGKIADVALNLARGNIAGVLLPLLPPSMQKTVRALTSDPFSRFALQTTQAALRGQNILRAAEVAAKAGIEDLREKLRFASMVAGFVPGIGTGVAAALGAASALAAGQPITEAIIAAARSAIPGGAIAQAAFDVGSNLLRGKSLSEAALAAARNQLPGGPAAKAAFDAAVALAQGKKIQDAAFAAAGQVLPKSPFAADALSFARRVAAGEDIRKAALSTAGNMVVRRLERQGVNLLRRATPRVPGLPRLRQTFPGRREMPSLNTMETAAPLVRRYPPRIHLAPQAMNTLFEIEPFEFESSVQLELGTCNRQSRDYIKWVQDSLNQIMEAGLDVDGISGPLTKAAVRSFQQQFGLAVDGIVGPQTEGALLGAGASPPPCGGAPLPSPPFPPVPGPVPPPPPAPVPVFPACNFLPTIHGFKFDNSFSLPASMMAILARVLAPLGIAVGSGGFGMCGGMVAHARDCFHFGVPIPPVTSPPAIGSALFNRLVSRQMDSLNLAISAGLNFAAPVLKFARWMRLPDRGPGSVAALTAVEFFSLLPSLAGGGVEILGLVLASAPSGSLTDNHQVLARCIVQRAPDTFAIRIYDPNFHDCDDITLEVTLTGGEATTAEVVPGCPSGGPLTRAVRGFFVMPYRPVRP